MSMESPQTASMRRIMFEKNTKQETTGQLPLCGCMSCRHSDPSSLRNVSSWEAEDMGCAAGDYLKLFLHLDSGSVNEYTPWTGLLCGNRHQIPHVLYSSGPALVLEFHTYHIPSNSTGFIGSFRFIDKRLFRIDGEKLAGTMCDYQFMSSNTTPSEGRFYSPRYPSSYPTHLRCSYRFRARNHERVRVVFEEVTLQKGDIRVCWSEPVSTNGHLQRCCWGRINEFRASCLERSDVLRVYDGWSPSFPVIGELCNEMSHVEMLSTGTHLYVELVSVSQWPGQRFKASFHFQEHRQHTDSWEMNSLEPAVSATRKLSEFATNISAKFTGQFSQ